MKGEELEGLEACVEEALRRGGEGGLKVLGYGEITLVLAWPPGDPRFACKRLPVFENEERFSAYAAHFERYLEALASRGIKVLESEILSVRRPDGALAAYVVQPILDEEALLPRVLACGDRELGETLIREVVARVAKAVDETVGLDAQVSNWAVVGDDLVFFDVSTPMLREDGRDLLDVDVFLAALPWALRLPVRRFLVGEILARYHRPRDVLLDMAANLIKERLQGWIPVVLSEASVALPAGTPPIDQGEVRRYYRQDALIWEFLQRARRLDRVWQRKIRRRAYPFLLPPRIER